MTNPAKLFAAECRFVAGATEPEALPEARYPEIAFAGRSNVGKSSLINALTGRKALARASQSPGRTRQLNFFLLGERLMLVDLPGYGFARASKAEIGRWTRLTKAYLYGRPTLQRVFLLIDARRGVMDSDISMMDRLDDAALPFQLVLTKADKLAKDALQAQAGVMETHVARHAAALQGVISASAHDLRGIEPLRAIVASFALDGARK